MLIVWVHLKFAAAPAWSDYIIGSFQDAFKAATTDDTIAEYIREGTTTIFHPMGPASMAAFGSSDGVVNPNLTVKSASGLCIVDVSVITFMTSSHPSGMILLAERPYDVTKQAQN